MNISLEECKKFEGYLFKKSPKLFKGYQKRYFRILDGKILVYSEKKEDNSTIKGQISLSQITIPQAVDKNVFKFILEGREFILKSETEENQKKWIYVLTTLINLERGNEDNKNPLKSVQRVNSLKLNKIQSMTKNNMEILESHGFYTNSNDDEISKELLSAKGIDKLLNLHGPKILDRIYYGFLYKQHPRRMDHFQKRWFFIFSSRPLFDKKYIEDETNLESSVQKDWIKFDVLYYFKFEGAKKYNEFQAQLELKNSHKIELLDKPDKFFLLLDVEDRVFQFNSDIKAKRDIWFEVLKNSRRTAKEFMNSKFGNPRNVELLNNIFLKSEEKFMEKINNERNNLIGNYKEIKDFNILEFSLNNYSEIIVNTVDGCLSSIPQKLDLMKKYIEINNESFINIIEDYWKKNYNEIENSNLIKLALLLSDLNLKIQKCGIVDDNLTKNGNEFIKIYIKKTYKNMLEIIKNILKDERENKAIKQENGILITNGPKDLFNFLSQTLDLLKGHKNKYLYENTLYLYYESILQYLIGVDCVINNEDIIVENEFLISIANNSFNMIQLLNHLIEDIKHENVISDNEINEYIQLKKLMLSINMMCQISISKFVNNFNNDLNEQFKNKNFKDLEIMNILVKTKNIFEGFTEKINPYVMKKCWCEMLKITVFLYIRSLLTTAIKNIENIEILTNKIKDDEAILCETYESVVGKNLTTETTKILRDINDFLNVNSYMISSTCLTLRQYIGPSFTIQTCRALIKLRTDFSNEEKDNCISECKEILDKYVDNKNLIGGDFDYFHKLEQEIQSFENEESNLENNNENENKNIEKEKVNETIILDDFLNEDDSFLLEENNEENKEKKEEEEEEKKEENKNEELIQQAEVSDIIKEGNMYKKSKNSWQLRFFQLKNGYLYWFKDKNHSKIQNKINIKEVIRCDSHKEKKFLIVLQDENNSIGKIQGRIYKFKCASIEETNEWISAISKEMSRLNEGEKNLNLNYEVKSRKKVIKDLFYLPDVEKYRSYIKNITIKEMENENYFKLSPKKIEEIRKKKEKEEEERKKIEMKIKKQLELEQKIEIERKKKLERDEIERKKNWKEKKKKEKKKKK